MYGIHDEFPQLPGLRYLNHAAISPWPRRAVLAVKRFAEQNAQVGARDYADWLKVERSLRERLTRLLNAPCSDDIALVKSTSEALSFVAFGLGWRAGDQVVISNEEFPSNRVVWEALEPQGVDVIKDDLHSGDPETNLLNACGPRTPPLSGRAVQYASGLRLDLQRLGHGCRQRGVLFCIDAIQQLGALPFDVQACQCAFAMADGHKWLLGPEGLGVFYCRSDLRQDWQPAHSARRFECGSPNLLGSMALEASLSLLEEVGMIAVGKAVQARAQWLLDGLAGMPGITLHSPIDPARRAGIVTFSLAGWDNQSLFQRLRSEQVICAQRGAGIRLSPHFYSEARVIEETLSLLHQLATG